MSRMLARCVGFVGCAALLVLLTGCIGWRRGGEAPPGGLEPQAEEVLRRMAGYLQQQPVVRFTAVEQTETSGAGGRRTGRRVWQVELVRPERLSVRLEEDSGRRLVQSDGRELRYVDEVSGESASWPSDTTLEKTLEQLKKRRGFELPLDALLRSRPYEALVRTAESGEYLGVADLDGSACERLGFTRGSREWELWIASGPQPWPLRFVLTDSTRRQVTRSVIDFRDWGSPRLSAEAETFGSLAPGRPRRAAEPVRQEPGEDKRALRRREEAERERQKQLEKQREELEEQARDREKQARKEQERRRKEAERQREEREELERLNRRIDRMGGGLPED